ncbi:MAG TPA: hypothetical protein VFQ61_31350, partial [Polyangiaceae bacterium]|nr:hypothetical protein [Polyangiaceae bacterium]
MASPSLVPKGVAQDGEAQGDAPAPGSEQAEHNGSADRTTRRRASKSRAASRRQEAREFGNSSRVAQGGASGQLDRASGRYLLIAVKRVLASEVGGRVKLMLAAILVLLVGVSALNVVNSYVGRDLMTAIEQGHTAQFLSKAVLWASIFGVSTVVAVIARFIEERLGLLWREWLTRTLVGNYLTGGQYLALKEHPYFGNPDQRIADDARNFTTTTLSFGLMLLNAFFGIVGFSGVLWSISPALMLVAIGYAAFGSLATIALGRPLVR